MKEITWNLTQTIEATGDSKASRMARRQVMCTTTIEVCPPIVYVARVTKHDTDSPGRYEKPWSRDGQTYGTHDSEHKRLAHEHQISRTE